MTLNTSVFFVKNEKQKCGLDTCLNMALHDPGFFEKMQEDIWKNSISVRNVICLIWRIQAYMKIPVDETTIYGLTGLEGVITKKCVFESILKNIKATNSKKTICNNLKIMGFNELIEKQVLSLMLNYEKFLVKKGIVCSIRKGTHRDYEEMMFLLSKLRKDLANYCGFEQDEIFLDF